MKAVLVPDWMPFEKLSLSDVPVPEPGEKQVRIEIKAAGVNFATSLVVQGKYQRKPPLPFVPGTEIAGVVNAVGSGVTRFAVGDRVCAVMDWGALAEQACALEVNTFALPDTLDFAPAISFTNSYATSAAALTWSHLLDVQPGDWLLVHGATGGVGIAAVEIGKFLGATVIATAGSDEKLGIAREHGADHAINYNEQIFRDEVLALTDGRGVDKVYDPVGGDVFMQSLRCMAPHARIVPIGFAGGQIPQIPANLLLVKNISVCGLFMGLYYGWSPIDKRYEYEDLVRKNMSLLFDWFEQGVIRPRIGATYPLELFQQAMADVLQRRAVGRIAVVME